MRMLQVVLGDPALLTELYKTARVMLNEGAVRCVVAIVQVRVCPRVRM